MTDKCEHIYFHGLFIEGEHKYKRADCKLSECIYPARYCLAKHQAEYLQNLCYLRR